MHRLPVPAACLAAEAIELPPAAAKHLKVLRPKAGEEIELFDGAGHLRRCRVEAGGRVAPASPVAFVPPPAAKLTLFACVTKGSRWDWTIEKATELGVSRIVPVLSERTIVRIAPAERAAKRERWMRVAEDAARQSDAAWMPEIVEPLDFEPTLDLVRRTVCFVGALVTPPAPPLRRALCDARGAGEDGWAVYVGPEGDFTPTELAALLEIASPVSFGPTVLRAETAAIFAVSVLAAGMH